jgi:YegS/Rv2252/BmrU family lipid kinase
MRIGIIINPVSGRAGRRPGTGARRSALARTLLATRRIEADVRLTRGPGHAAEIARGWLDRGYDRVIAWGGDGTVSEVARPLVGTHASLGIVRSGSGDGFARGLRIPGHPARAMAVALSARTRAIDVGRFGDRHFLNVVGIGFDGAVAHASHVRLGRGVFGYITDGLARVWRYVAADYVLDLDGVRLSGPRFLVAFANGPQYGNNVVLAPDADPGDGTLDVLVVADGTPLQQFWRARRLIVRRRHPARGLIRMRVRTARVSGDLLTCHLDGEPYETSGSVEVSLLPAALRVAVPAAQARGLRRART